MNEKKSSYQYRQSLSFIDQKPKFLQNFLKPSHIDRSEEEIEKLKKEKNKDDIDDEQPQIVVLNEEKDFSKEEMEQYLINNPNKKISEEIQIENSKEKEFEESRFNKIFQKKKIIYDKNYKETGRDSIKKEINKNNDIDYNEYTFGNELKRDSLQPKKVIFRKPVSHKEDNDLISSSKGIKRKLNEEKHEIDVKNNPDSNKKLKSKRHNKARKQKTLLSFSMDDEQ
ncbi:hypothetical protein BCR36DRAFT_320739 [Piromyces finnis]|uniref:DUF4604 domain-containing protein n=1 Tax=Piromyces finnis TaxID=1754191 RepID=A0A1Y1VHR0_9FUNG|nr:hypothetical protein BCR36DRAFT_320739 [Piromyces finnis]|eukprot:ORX56001.1 hypothetical protein BCR36DRAFT_320739 [Piromyces finnis]